MTRRRAAMGDRIHLDLPMVFLLLAIAAYGLLILDSAVGQQTGPVVSQAIKVLVGVGVMVVIAQTPTSPLMA